MNKEKLTERAEELAAELGTTVDTADKTNAELKEIVAGLEGEQADASGGETPPAVSPPVAVKHPPFYMVKGKSLTTLQGIKADGDEITAADFPNGQDAVDDWVSKGYVAKA